MTMRKGVLSYRGCAIGVIVSATLIVGTIAISWMHGGGSRCLRREALLLTKHWDERDSAFVRLSLPVAYDVMICNVYFPGYDHGTLEQLFARNGRAAALEIRRRLPMERERRANLSALIALRSIHYTGRYNVLTDSATMTVARTAAHRWTDVWYREPALAIVHSIELRR